MSSFTIVPSFRPSNDHLSHQVGTYLLKRSLILTSLIGFLHLKESSSELRFCYRGPHKMEESECPGGFIAFKPLNISCIFYAKAPDIPDLNVTFSENLCDNTSQEMTLDPKGKTDLTGITNIHRIFIEPVDETADPTSGVDLNATVCVHSCFSEWVDPFDPEDDLMFLEKPDRSEDQVKLAKATYVQNTKELFVQLVIDDDNLFDDDEDIVEDEMDDSDTVFEKIPDILGEKIDSLKGKYPYIFKLLAQTLRITILKCAPFIEIKYMLQVLRVMIHFYDKNEDFVMLDIDPFTFRNIFKNLKECEGSSFLKVDLNGTQCGNRHTIESIILTDENGTASVWPYRRLPRSFRWGIYDPAIESAWAAVDFVHGICFQPFYVSGNILYFHLYMKVMGALFPPEPVQAHWMNPVKLKNDYEFWNTIMDTNDIQNQVRNLDACAIAAYKKNLSPYMDRLLRPFVKEAKLRNPKYEKFIPSVVGWKRSSEEYWSWYESIGGFKEISKNFGYCLDGSRENLEEVERKLMEKGLNC